MGHGICRSAIRADTSDYFNHILIIFLRVSKQLRSRQNASEMFLRNDFLFPLSNEQYQNIDFVTQKLLTALLEPYEHTCLFQHESLLRYPGATESSISLFKYDSFPLVDTQ